MTDLYASSAIPTGQSGASPSPTTASGARELEAWFSGRAVLADAPSTVKERLRRRIPARTFIIIWGPTVRNLALRPQSWRPSTVCALAAVMGADLIEGSGRMARWRGVVDQRLS